MASYVAYYRVSTTRQGDSGLGLEAQKEICKRFVQGKGDIMAEYVDVYSGKSENRPNLIQALEYSKRFKATLLIAKLDRLSRNVSFIFKLRDMKVDFVCVDLPEFNTMTLGVFAAFAQHEGEKISERTKAALAIKKEILAKEGKKLGNLQHLTKEQRERGWASSSASRKRKCEEKTKMIKSLYSKGLNLHQIRDTLTDMGILSKNGTPLSLNLIHLHAKRIDNVRAMPTF